MREPRSDWRAIVSAYKASGQSPAEWCRASGVNLSNLRYWLRKAEESAPEGMEVRQWLAFDFKASQAAGQNTLEQRLTLHIGPARVTVTPGFDPQLLADVAKALSALC